MSERRVKLMKRRLFAVLGAALVLTLLASFAVLAAEKKTYEFVVITHSASIDFWVPLVKGAEDAAAMINAANPNVEVTVRHTGPVCLMYPSREISWRTSLKQV